jgi:hypothetical protein
VTTFVGLLDCIIRIRHQKHGLLLSELGAYLLSPEQAPAGTKRTGNLLEVTTGITICWRRLSSKKPCCNLSSG